MLSYASEVNYRIFLCSVEWLPNSGHTVAEIALITSLIVFFIALRQVNGRYLQITVTQWFRTQPNLTAEDMPSGFASWFFSLLGIMAIGTYLASAFNLLGSDFFVRSLLFSGAVAVLFLSRNLLILVANLALKIPSEAQWHQLMNERLIQGVGILTLPFLLAVRFANGAFQEAFFLAGLVMMGLCLLIYFIRLIIISIRRSNHSATHIILYICTLEFLPILIIAKVVLTRLDSISI